MLLNTKDPEPRQPSASLFVHIPMPSPPSSQPLVPLAVSNPGLLRTLEPDFGRHMAHVVLFGWQPYAQVMPAGFEHAPTLLQVAAGFATPPEQEAWAHVVSAPGYMQLVPLVPSHLPPQIPLPLQGVRGVVTEVHFPAVAEHD